MLHLFAAGLRCTVDTTRTGLAASSSTAYESRQDIIYLTCTWCTSIMRTPRYGGMYCPDLESLNWLARCTWLMATDQYLIVLARSCIGSFRGEAHIESQASSPCGLPGGVPWTERPDRSTPSAPVLRRVGNLLPAFEILCIIMWPSWLVRRSRVDVDSARRKWSSTKAVAWGDPAPYGFTPLPPPLVGHPVHAQLRIKLPPGGRVKQKAGWAKTSKLRLRSSLAGSVQLDGPRP